MSLKIFLAQSPNEIIRCSEASKLCIVPLDLATQLFCIKKNISYIDLSNHLDNELHDSIATKLSFYDDYFKYLSGVNLAGEDLAAFVRFALSQVFFIDEIIKVLDASYGLVDIYTSGWEVQTSNLYSDENYTVSEIARFLYGDRINELNKTTKCEIPNNKIFVSLKAKRVDLLINSRGYNMHRLVHAAKQEKLKVGVLPGDYNFPSIAKSFLMGIHIPRCEYSQIKFEGHFRLTDINLPDGEIGEFLSKILERKKNNFSNIAESGIAVEEMVSISKPSSVYSWSMRGPDGHLLRFSHANNIRATCIPHGTVSRGYNRSDLAYKQLIANAVFSGECSYLAIQSKIACAALENIKYIGKPIITGNLIFAEENRKSAKHLLYAVTLKGFYGMQFCGVELHYEFLKNLNTLEKISRFLNIPVLVNLHPSAHSLINNLQELHPSLSFSIEGVAAGLKNAIAAISYSSSSIEDSLYSKVPVILFDQWSRYRHCEAIDNIDSEAIGAVYYASDEQKLIDCIKLLYEPNFKVDLCKYIYEGNSLDNFRNLIKLN